MIASRIGNLAKSIQGDEAFQAVVLGVITSIIVILAIVYYTYTSRLEGRECSYMESLYPSLDGYLRPINEGDPDCREKLCDYFVKTAFNACSGGSYKNDFVNTCNLKALLRQGVRGIDLEIYSIDSTPVVATSTTNDYRVKETYNSVPFSSVLEILRNYAFSSGTCPNPTDPLLLHLRIKSNHIPMYEKLLSIIEANTDLFLGKEYSYETDGKNVGQLPLLSLQNKILLIVDRSNPKFIEVPGLSEYINLTSNSMFMRKYSYFDVRNNPDLTELTEFNKRSMTIVVPDGGSNPPNPAGAVCRASGCHMVAMRYQWVDNNLLENTLFFDQATYAFALKPEILRYKPVTVSAPVPQNPEYSYETRSVKTDYYNFQF